MFTGIVTDIGTIASVEQRGDTRLTIETSYDTATIDLGASIACSGVCLTVVDKGPGWFAVDVSAETMKRTAVAGWTEGKRLNLERPLKVGDELGGHIVTGHVDDGAEVVEIENDGDSKRVSFLIHSNIAPYIAQKGSVTLNGVSLTVNDVLDGTDRHQLSRFTVNLIPHTQAVTTLGDLAVGQFVNLEIDVLARYLQRMEHYRGRPNAK